ncbi:MAG: hypothetical protein IPH59_05430 [bacterium]|nr:hypothetical protein [bacterium]
MKSKIRILLFGVLALLVVGLIGCSDNNVTPEQGDDESINLTDNFGGYKATDEQPAFGDPDIASLEGSAEANDPIMLNPDVDSITKLLDIGVYSVEFLWGHLELDSTEVAVTDWSGSLTLERGAIVAVRLIRFEAGDFIVRPRLSRTVLEFESKTRPSFDGMLVYIYDPTPSVFDTENTLTFTSGPITQTFTMSELASISTVTDVGSNQFSVNGFKIERLACGEGYLEGRWIRPASVRGQGTFVGRWISEDGLMLGHVRGHFGNREDDVQVLFGKWISVAGLFRGFLKGEWGYGTDDDPSATDKGWLSGDIFNREAVAVGEFDANWVARERPGNGNNDRAAKHGYFRGQWSQNCE